MHAYDVRPRKHHRGFDLISDVLHSVPSSPLGLVFFRIASVSGLCAETFASAVSLANRGLDDACIALSCDAESAFAVFAAPKRIGLKSYRRLFGIAGKIILDYVIRRFDAPLALLKSGLNLR
jgi:hypothetical protein